MKIISFILFTAFTLLSCTPEQPVTEFSTTFAPTIAGDKEFSTEFDTPVTITYQYEGSVEKLTSPTLVISQKPENGSLSNCNIDDLFISCLYTPTRGFFGQDLVYLKLRDGDFFSSNSSIIAVNVGLPIGCEDQNHGDELTRIQYETPSVPYGGTCISEVQTKSCYNGTWGNWSGPNNYENSTCSIEAPLTCGDIAHNSNETRTMYKDPVVEYEQTCIAETQTRLCTNGNFGIWTGSYVYSSCSVKTPLNCGTLAHGQSETRQKYKNTEVAYGGTCESEQQTRTCTNGVLSSWSGSYTGDTCSVQDPLACGELAHGQTETRIRYKESQVGYGETCASETQTRLCTNGSFGDWSGSYTNTTCSIDDPQACGSIAHGQTESRQMFKELEVAYGGSCESEDQTRLCTNGRFSDWSGTYANSSCTITDPLACGNIAHGDSETRTMYETAEVTYNGTCMSEDQTRICTNGSFGDWSGSYDSSSCVIADPLACGETAHEEVATRTRYNESSVAYGATCESEVQTSLCTNGVLGDWTGTFTQTSCVVEDPLACGEIAHDSTDSRTMYKDATVAYGASCESETQTRLCTNGSFDNWTGTYTHSTCEIELPLACGETAHNESETRTMYKDATVAYGETCVSETQTRLCTNGTLTNWSGTYTHTSCSVDAPNVEEITQNCTTLKEGGSLLVKTLRVDFPSAIECNFNEDGVMASDLNAEGNGPRKDARIRARKEQYVNLSLGESGVLCDMEFIFPEQSMEYDDEILLTLNNYVLMMSTDYSTNSSYDQYAQQGLLVNSLGLPVYNWHGTNALYDLDYGYSKAPPFCLGLSSDDSTNCSIPATQTFGKIKLNIPSSEIIKIGFADKESNLSDTDLNFGFISTGDNDNGDCEHSAYGFDVKVYYYK